ncbi:hypothetical protein [Rheinheimera faecalis]|uniref:hypothetical protein n=1 Tax=Rheinheimera faecalis TaxID=2901141 RepID=UPI001E5292D1|nr:hypothetical protein [Rheinheimera faecalis]
MNKKQNIWILTTGLTLSLLGFLLHRASNIAFFYEKNLFNVTVALTSLSILVLVIYFGFIKKNDNGKSDWQNNYQGAATKRKKISICIASIILIPAFSLFIGFILTVPPAVPCDIFAAKHFSRTAVITDINNTGRTPGVFVRLYVDFKNDNYSESFKWKKPSLDSEGIKAGDTILIAGQTCGFGFVINKITRAGG